MNTDHFEIYGDRSRLVLPDLHGLGWCKTVSSRVGGPRTDGIDCFEIGYLHSGSIEWLAEHGLEEAGPSSIFIDWPGDWHGGANAIIHPCERYWVRFDLDALSATPMLPSQTLDLVRRRLYSFKSRHFPASPTLQSFFLQVLEQQRKPGPFGEELSRAAFHQILFTTINSHEQTVSGRYSPTVRKALEFIKNNIDADFYVSDLADHVGLSCGYFHDLFQQETGFTPARYQLNARVREAKNQLIRTDRSITDIALGVGFSSSQYFATAFRRVTGLTPRDYRLLRSDLARPPDVFRSRGAPPSRIASQEMV